MSGNNYYAKGQWNTICDICGYQFKSGELRKRWDGFMVDSRCWEPRHPQDFVRGVADIQAPVWTRPEAQDQFVAVYGVIDHNSVAGSAHAGLMQAGTPLPSWYNLNP